MKSTITIGVVIAAIIAVIAVKVLKKECGAPEQSSFCLCSMIKSAQSNEAPTAGAPPVE